MTQGIEIKNAIIKSARIGTDDRSLLTVWLDLDYGNCGQDFGGYSLYLSKDYKHFTNKGDFAGHFIYRCMEVAGVQKWSDIAGKTIRVKSAHSKVHEIGHIVKEDWFNPSEDFKKMNEQNTTI